MEDKILNILEETNQNTIDAETALCQIHDTMLNSDSDMSNHLNDWVNNNIGIEHRNEEEFNNADMIMFADYYYKQKINVLDI